MNGTVKDTMRHLWNEL